MTSTVATMKPVYLVSLDSESDSDSEEDQSFNEPDLEPIQAIQQVMRPLFIATSNIDDEESD